MTWTILVLIMWTNSLVAEDFGEFTTIEHCEKVALEMQTKLENAGAKSVAVCVPNH